jgi:hypothetical protein
MTGKLCQRALVCAVCLGLLGESAPARADSLKTDADEIGIAIVAVAAALGVGIFFAIHHGASIKGCAESGPDGLAIRNQGDQALYQLTGDSSGVKAGELVRVKGKKKSAKSGAARTFVVSKLAKDFGACPAGAPAQP